MHHRSLLLLQRASHWCSHDCSGPLEKYLLVILKKQERGSLTFATIVAFHASDVFRFRAFFRTMPEFIAIATFKDTLISAIRRAVTFLTDRLLE